MRLAGTIIKRTLVSFYDDQMTQHAAALTYYALMSLFPARAAGALAARPARPVSRDLQRDHGLPARRRADSVVDPLDRSLRSALQSKGTAATALAISVVVALYGTTGALEAARRALNVVFEVESGRSFLRRKAIDVPPPSC